MAKEIILTMVIRREQKGYAAWCPELDIASQGETFEDAKKNLREAVGVYVETVVADGAVQELLERLGTTYEDFKKKEVVHPESFSGSFEVPIAI